MGDRGAFAWTTDETALLVRAWAAAAAESAPRSATARAVYAHFQRLAVGGESGRAEKAVQARRALLHNMYSVIRTHDAHVAASGAALHRSDENVAVSEAEGEVVPVLLLPWFQLPEHERRRRFAELNKRSWTLFTDLTEEQCASIAALKALGGGGGGAIPSDASDAEGGAESGDESHVVAARVAKWDADETTRLLLAWQQVTEANAPKRATAKEIFQRFEKLSANGSSGRAEVSVIQRYTILRNIHTVIQTYDARVLADATTTTQPTQPTELRTLTDDASVDSEVVAPPPLTLSPPPPRLWFSLGESERRRGFAELNTRKWLQYATMTERQFETVSLIKDLTAATVLPPVAPTPVLTLSLVDPTLASASPPDVSASTETGTTTKTTTTDRTTAEFAAKMHRWCSDDTTLLVRAWTEVAEANAHRKVTAKEVARRFEELSDGGSSGRSLTAIPQKHTILRNMFTIICVYNERALAAGEECGDGRAARLWFALSKDERRRFFAEMNKKSWTHFVDLTEPQFDAITAIEQRFASVILDRAETAAAAADGSESPVAFDSASVELSSSVPAVDVSVLKSESTTTTSDTITSDNDRSSVVDVVLPSLSLSPPIPPVPVQRAFWGYTNTTQLLQAWAETRVVKQNPRPSSSEVAHHFQRTAMDDTKQTTESSIRLRHSMLHNLYSIICAYNDKVTAATATLATLATDGESETNGSLSLSLSLSLSPPLPWFSLPLDERRRVFNDMNAKTSCWFVDMPKEHFCFIEETLRQDVGAPPLAVVKLSPSPTREVVPVVVKPAPAPSPTPKDSKGKHSGGDGKRARMWTTEHTTVMLRAWEDVVSDPQAAKPTTGTLYTHFLTLTDGNGGAESSFIHRFRSMRFLHSIIIAYNSQRLETRDDNNDNNENNDDKRDTEEDVVVDQMRSHDDSDSNDNNSWNKWFELPLGDRRRRFNDAGGKALLFVDLTREQFDTLSRILSNKSYPMPMITRRADTRDRSTTALGDHDTSVDGVKSSSKRARTRPATGEQQRSKQRRLLPAPSGVAGLGVGAVATGRPMVKSARGTTIDSDVESAIAHASRQLSVVMERMQRNDSSGLRYHATAALSSPSSTDSSSSSSSRSRPHGDANSDRSDSDDGDVDDYDWGSARIPRSSVGDSGDDNEDNDNDSDSELQDASSRQLPTATGPHLPVPRGGAQSRLVAAAAVLQQQTETLAQLLRDTRETRARDAAERRYLVSCMRRDEKERQEAEHVLRSRVDEIRRQRATWRDEWNEMKRVYAELREGVSE